MSLLELGLIFIVALLVLGPKKMQSLLCHVGKIMQKIVEFKKEVGNKFDVSSKDRKK